MEKKPAHEQHGQIAIVCCTLLANGCLFQLTSSNLVCAIVMWLWLLGGNRAIVSTTVGL